MDNDNTEPAFKFDWASAPDLTKRARTTRTNAAMIALNGGAPAPERSAPTVKVPGVATTFWIAALFGIFGLIPMLMHSKEARQAGVQDTSNYVAAFVLGMIACVVGVVLVGLML